MVKSPLFIFHSWLPKAHVESPLAGSIVLSGIILKFGSYGIYLISPCLAPWVSFVVSLSLFGSVFCALVCLRSSDIKSLIAYSSVVHMGFVTLGLLSSTELGFWCATSIIFSHTLVRPHLFCLAYELYSAFGSRSLISYSKHGNSSLFLLLLTLSAAANFGLPPFLPFFSEYCLFVLLSFSSCSWWLCQGLVSLLTFCYSILLPVCVFGLGSNRARIRPVSVTGLFPPLPPLALSIGAGLLFSA